MSFSENLKKMMGKRSLNQSQLAKKAGVSVAAINHFLAGRRTPSSQLLSKIADALAVTPGRLLGTMTDESVADLLGLESVEYLVRQYVRLTAADQERVVQMIELLAESTEQNKEHT